MNKNDITKELLYDLYVSKELSTLEIANKFNTTPKSIRAWVKRFNLYRDPSISQNHRINKQKNTLLEKYGVDSYSKTPEYKNKVKQTSLEKYGETNAAKSQVIKDKIKNNNLKKYGETNPLKVNDIKERIRINQLLNKGYSYPYQLNKDPDITNVLYNKDLFREYLESHKYTIDEIANNLGYHRTAISHLIHKYGLEGYVNYKPNHSSYEKEISELFPNFKPNRTVLSPQEIDLYDDINKLGIEFNGNYWHSIDNKGRNYHQNKTLLAISKDIRLIHIFQYEWDDDTTRNKIINLINGIINPKSVIYARECIVKTISSKESRDFLNKYHLQNYYNSSINIGLFYKDSLVGVMSLGKSRFNKNYEYELHRLCFSEYNIVGGSSKLFKYFIKNFNPKSVISYCDISKFTGKVYVNLGFKLIKTSNPNYVYCNNKGDIKTRYSCQKHKLLKIYSDNSEFNNMSENDIMYSLGYWKIEDSGNQVYLWTSDNQ